ncbi:MAG: aldo/keto reductase [Candidatus Promineifilaceae bacterium]|nr:aldo/keto reductase [Candidatus Promineifilaceae bacterium]
MDLQPNNGIEIPTMGLGVFRSAAGQTTVDTVRWALEVGCRHIDTAVYNNEASVGRAVRESALPRERVFVTINLWRDEYRYLEPVVD